MYLTNEELSKLSTIEQFEYFIKEEKSFYDNKELESIDEYRQVIPCLLDECLMFIEKVMREMN